MEYTRAKWTRYGGHIVKAKRESITQTFHSNLFGGPLQLELSKFHCIRGATSTASSAHSHFAACTFVVGKQPARTKLYFEFSLFADMP